MTDLARCDVPFVAGLIWQEPDLGDRPLNSSFVFGDDEILPNFDPTGKYKPGNDKFSNGNSKWSLRHNQLAQGSCTSNMGSYLLHHEAEKTDYKWDWTPSRPYIYWNTRKDEGNENEDSGATIRGTIKAMAKYGCVPEDGGNPWHMVYNDQDYRTVPTDLMRQHARYHTTLEYQSVSHNAKQIKSLLMQDIPIGFGFLVHESFMTNKVAKSGVMPKPGGVFDDVEGGHAVTAVGYLTDFKAGDQGITDWIIVVNSWGRDWGNDGVFLLPLKEVFLKSREASDFWAITKVGFKAAA